MSNIEYSSESMIKIDEQKITTARTGQRKSPFMVFYLGMIQSIGAAS